MNTHIKQNVLTSASPIVLDTIDEILTIIEDSPPEAAVCALLGVVYALAHERKPRSLNKTELIAFLNRRAEQDFNIYTRARIEEAIDNLRRRRRAPAHRVN